VRANWEEDLPPAGIVDREEVEARRYRGLNPAFVRQVWEKRRSEAPKPASRWTPERKAEVARMMAAGLSTGQIAKAFNVTRSAIAGLVHNSPELREIGFQTAYAEKMRGRTLRDAR